MICTLLAQARLFVATSCRALARDERANVALIVGLAAPVLFAAVGAAVDYTSALATRAKMQDVADSAAVIAVREFQMAKATRDTVAAVARNYVTDRLKDVAVTPTVDDKALTVRVVVEKDLALTIGKFMMGDKVHVRTSATAKLDASLPLCLLALDGKAPDTLSLEKSAQMTAPGCMVYSNSVSNKGLEAKDSAVVTAGLICTAGGKYKGDKAKFSPNPVTDCPVMDNPLATRAPPPVGPCSFYDMVISGGTQTLQPGVYCGGLKITNSATVTLAPGVYVIKDGPLKVEKSGTMTGTDVGFYLNGKGSNLTFDQTSTISLSAPKDGPMAGLLIFDDPTGASAPAVPPVPLPEVVSGLVDYAKGPPRDHKILSDNARLLLGTIYMPQGRLIIDATKPIADKSAYTVMVVRRIDLHDGPNLVLNSDYSATEVPVPKGVGPVGQVMLTN
jgi:Flp pilus assembly protein TadG